MKGISYDIIPILEGSAGYHKNDLTITR